MSFTKTRDVSTTSWEELGRLQTSHSSLSTHLLASSHRSSWPSKQAEPGRFNCVSGRFETSRTSQAVSSRPKQVSAAVNNRSRSRSRTFSEADRATSTRIDSDPSCGHGRWYSLAVLVRFTGCSRLRRRRRLGLSYCYGRSSSSPWPGASRLERVRLQTQQVG
jgi:hypothetical protein